MVEQTISEKNPQQEGGLVRQESVLPVEVPKFLNFIPEASRKEGMLI